MSGPINLLDRQTIGFELSACVNELGKLERGVFKKEPAALKLCKDFLIEINNFRPYLSIIKCVNNPGMKERH